MRAKLPCMGDTTNHLGMLYCSRKIYIVRHLGMPDLCVFGRCLAAPYFSFASSTALKLFVLHYSTTTHD